LAESLAYPSGEEAGNFLVQMISTCLPSCRGRGDGGRHPVGYNNFDFFGKIKSMDPGWMEN